MSAIRKLVEAVEGGDLAEVNTVLGRMFAADHDMPWDWVSNVNSAFRGSVDAALALMQAMLPGWTVNSLHEIRRPDKGMGPTGKWDCLLFAALPGKFEHVTATAETPARALLLAILKAMEATQGET